MRRFSCSWDRTLAALGFRRNVKRIRREYFQRKACRHELLEMRAMLSSSPNEPIRPEYVLAGWAEGDTPEQFLVSTEFDIEGHAIAVVRLDPSYAEPDYSQQELVLELRLGELVMDRHEVSVNLADREFVEDFRRSRSSSVLGEMLADPHAAAGDPLSWSAQLNLQGVFDDLGPGLGIVRGEHATTDALLESAKRLAGLAQSHEVIGNVLLTQPERASFLAGLARVAVAVESLSGDSEVEGAGPTRRDRIANELGRATLLSAHFVTEGIASPDPATRSGALATRELLLRVLSPYYTVFGPLKGNSTLAGENSLDEGGTALLVIEEGVASFGDRLRIEVGPHSAFVEATLSPGFAVAGVSAPVLIDNAAFEDAVFVTSGPAGGYGYDSLTLDVSTNRNAILKTTLPGLRARPVESATLTVQATDSAETLPVTLRGSFPSWAGGGAGYGWTESALDWNWYEHVLNDALTGGEIVAVPQNGVYSFDVTPWMQRSLYFGDANLDGSIHHGPVTSLNRRGLAADVEAMHTAVHDWNRYSAEYAGAEPDAHLLHYRIDVNADGIVTRADAIGLLDRLGMQAGDFNFSGGVDSNDLAIYEANFNTPAASFGDGDANFDGWIDASDRSIWQSQKNINATYLGARDAAPYFELSSTSGASVSMHSSESASDRPTIDIVWDETARIVDFHARGSNGLATVALAETANFTGEAELWVQGESIRRAVAAVSTGAESVSFASAALDGLAPGVKLIAKLYNTTGGARSLVGSRTFSEGVVLDAAGNLHVWGTSLRDAVTVGESSLSVTFGDQAGPAQVEPIAAASMVYLHLGSGNDAVEIDAVTGAVLIDGQGGDDFFEVITTPTSSLRLNIADSLGFNTLHFWIEQNEHKLQAVNLSTLDLSSASAQRFDLTHRVYSSTVAAGTYYAAFGSPNSIASLTAENAIDGVAFPLGATPLVVDSLADIDDDNFGPGQLSLREALRFAKATDDGSRRRIEFDPALFAGGAESIVLTDGIRGGDSLPTRRLEVTSHVAIAGPGVDLLTIDADEKSSVLYVPAGGSLHLSDVTVARGKSTGDGAGLYARGDVVLTRTEWVGNSSLGGAGFSGGNGGAVYIQDGHLTVVDSEFSGNSARWGGALAFRSDNAKELTVSGSTLAGNAAELRGGHGGFGSAVVVTGYAVSAGDASFVNSTFTDNLARYGATIWVNGQPTGSTSDIDFLNSTIAHNDATGGTGGGAGILVSSGAARLSLANTILAENLHNHNGALQGGVARLDLQAAGAVAGSHNLLSAWVTGGWTTSFASDASNRKLSSSESAGLLPLGDYGGATRTLALGVASPAIDNGADTGEGGVPLADQRGFPRYDHEGVSGVIDIGAAEHQGAAPRLIAPATLRTFEDTELTLTGSNALSVQGADAGPLILTLTAPSHPQAGVVPLALRAADGSESTVSGDQSAATLVLSGTVREINQRLTVLSLLPVRDFAGVTTLAYTLHDGAALLQSGGVEVILSEVDDSIVVTSLSDTPEPNSLTLRQAIDLAEEGRTITFSPELNGEVIALGPVGDLVIRKSLTIDASALPDGLTIRAYDPTAALKADGSRAFFVAGADTHLTLRGVRLTGGDTYEGGGAIRALDAAVTLDRVEVSDNAAPRIAGFTILGYNGFIDYDDPDNFKPIAGPWQQGARGGGIYTTGPLVISDSRFVNNATSSPDSPYFQTRDQDRLLEGRSPEDMGEIFAGDIYSTSSVRITESTFSVVSKAAADVIIGATGTESLDANNLAAGMETATQRIGIPSDMPTLGLGGVYIVSVQGEGQPTIEVAGTVFDRTRGLVVDRMTAGDARGITEREADYTRAFEVRNVEGLVVYRTGNTAPVSSPSFVVPYAEGREWRFDFPAPTTPTPDPTSPSTTPPSSLEVRIVKASGNVGPWTRVVVTDARPSGSATRVAPGLVAIGPDGLYGSQLFDAARARVRADGFTVRDATVVSGAGLSLELRHGGVKTEVGRETFLPQTAGSTDWEWAPLAIPSTSPGEAVLEVQVRRDAVGEPAGIWESVRVIVTADAASARVTAPGVITVGAGATFNLGHLREALAEPDDDRPLVVMRDVTMIDPLGGLNLQNRASWADDPDLKYQVPADLTLQLQVNSAEDRAEAYRRHRSSLSLYNVIGDLRGVTLHESPTIESIGSFLRVSGSQLAIEDAGFLPSIAGVYHHGGGNAMVIHRSDVKISGASFTGLDNNRFKNSQDYRTDGTVVMDWETNLEVVESTFINNTAMWGQIVARPLFGAPLGSDTPVHSGSLKVVDSTFTGNRNSTGGAITVIAEPVSFPFHELDENGDPVTDEFGGSVLTARRIRLAGQNPYPVQIEGATITDNTRHFGGEVTSLPPYSNTLGRGGGGLTMEGPIALTLRRSLVSNNQSRGEGLHHSNTESTGIGGGVYLSDLWQARIEDSTISGNQAGMYGGGVFVQGETPLEMTNVTVTENFAGYQGGGVFLSRWSALGASKSTVYEQLTLSNSLVAGNQVGSAVGWWQQYVVGDPPPLGGIGVLVAGDSAATADLWAPPPISDRTYSPRLESVAPLSHESANNIIGVSFYEDRSWVAALAEAVGLAEGSPNAAHLVKPYTPALIDRDQVGGDPARSINWVGAGRVPALTPAADFGGPSNVHALRYDTVGGNPAVDVGGDRSLVAAVSVESDTWLTDAGAAYDLFSESGSLETRGATATVLDQDDSPASSGTTQQDWNGRHWASRRLKKSLPESVNERGFAGATLRFDLGREQDLTELVLWDAPNPAGGTDPTRVSTLVVELYRDHGRELVKVLPWDRAANGGSFEQVLNVTGNGTPVSADTVVLRLLKTSDVEVPASELDPTERRVVQEQARLGEVRFRVASSDDQRGEGFSRLRGAGVDIGAYESSPAYANPTELSAGGWAPLVVSSPTDIVDDDLGAGNLSLREAILLANLHDGAQTVVAPAGAAPDGRYLLTRGELRISDGMILRGDSAQGAGATGDVVIDASGSYRALPSALPPSLDNFNPHLPGRADLFFRGDTYAPLATGGGRNAFGSRVVNIDDGALSAIDVTISNLTATGGLVQGHGGGVRSTETLTLNQVNVVGNAAHEVYSPYGGGLLNYFTDVLPEAVGTRGGGVSHVGDDLTIVDSVIRDNTANASGGGVYASGGDIVVRTSVVEGNLVRSPTHSQDYFVSSVQWQRFQPEGGGVAIRDADSAVIADSRVAGNAALSGDVIVWNSAHAELPRAEGTGAALSYTISTTLGSFGGGLYLNNAPTIVSRSELSQNEAGQGGGLYVAGGESTSTATNILDESYLSLDVRSSTIAGNVARQRMHPLAGLGFDFINAVGGVGGAGISIQDDQQGVSFERVRVLDSTITENRLDPSGVGAQHIPQSFRGAAINAPGVAPPPTPVSDVLIIDGSIVAGNVVAPSAGPRSPFASTRFESWSWIDSDGVPRFGNSSGPHDPSLTEIYIKPFYSVGPGDVAADDLMSKLRIDNSLIGSNLGLTVTEPSEVRSQGYTLTGYVQSRLVDPTIDPQSQPGVERSLSWQDGGVPEPDSRGNLIGGLWNGSARLEGSPTGAAPNFYGGYLHPGLDALAYNGAATRTQSPMSVVPTPTTLLAPTSVEGAGADLEVGAWRDLISSPLAYFDATGEALEDLAAEVQSLPLDGSEHALLGPQRRYQSGVATTASASDDYFSAQPPLEAPYFEVQFDRPTRITDLVVWPYRSQVGGPEVSIGDEARVLELTVYRQGASFPDESLTVDPLVRTLRVDYTTSQTSAASSADVLPLMSDGADLGISLAVGDRVRITVTDNFHGVPDPVQAADGAESVAELQGRRVALGQIRFIGQLDGPRPVGGAALEPSTVSPAIDAIAATVTGVDQRGLAYASTPIDTRRSIGSHEYGGKPANPTPLSVDASVEHFAIPEGVVPIEGIKVAEVVVVNPIGAPLDFQILDGGDLFELRKDSLGRDTREVWAKGGARFDFESRAVGGQASHTVTVGVRDGLHVDDPATSNDESEAVVSFDVSVLDLNERPVAPSIPPQIDVPHDAWATPWSGIAVSSLIAAASDQDGDSLGIAITGVEETLDEFGRVQYSTDSGATWRLVGDLESHVVLLLSGDALLRVTPLGPTLSSPAGGILYRVWDRTLGDESAGQRVLTSRVESSLSEASVTNAPVRVAVSRRVGDPLLLEGGAAGAVLAIDPLGNSTVVRASTTGLRLSRTDRDGADLGPEQTITARSASNPEIAVWSDGGFIVLWRDVDGLHARRYAVSKSSGGRFDGLTEVSETNLTDEWGVESDAVVASVVAHPDGRGLAVLRKSDSTRIVLFGTDGSTTDVVDLVASSEAKLASSPSGDRLMAAIVERASGRPRFFSLLTSDDSLSAAELLLSQEGGDSQVGAASDLALAIPAIGPWAAAWKDTNVSGVAAESRLVQARENGVDGWTIDGGETQIAVITNGSGRRIDRVGAAASLLERGVAWTWSEWRGGEVVRRGLATSWESLPDGSSSVVRSNEVLVSNAEWASLNLEASADGRFWLISSENGGGSWLRRYAGRFAPNGVRLDVSIDGTAVTMTHPPYSTSVAPAVARYGGRDLLVVNSMLTEVDLTEVQSLRLLGSDQSDFIDLSRWASPRIELSATGGLGDDTYVLSNNIRAASFSISDAGGTDRILAESRVGSPLTFILGRAGRQTIGYGSQSSDSPAITLQFAADTTIEEVTARGSQAPLIFRRADKPRALVVTDASDVVGSDGLTLREALLWAATDPEIDEIQLPAAEIALTQELVFDSDVVIYRAVADGRPRIVAAPGHRAIRVTEGTVVTIRDVDLSGSDPTSMGVLRDGGVVHSLGELTLERTNVMGGSLAPGSTAAIGRGGAIYAGGVLSLYNSRVANGRAADYGGGIAFEGASAAIFDSEIVGSIASRGAGLAVLAGQVTIDGSTFFGNGSSGSVPITLQGGGVWQSDHASVAIIRSTISSNEAANGSGLYASPHTGGHESTPRLSVQRTTIAKNVGFGALDAAGYAIEARGLLIAENDVEPLGPGTAISALDFNLVDSAQDIVVDALFTEGDFAPRRHGLTHSASVANPAKDAIPRNSSTEILILDQTGRVPNGDSNADIGAIEAEGVPYAGGIALVPSHPDPRVREGASIGSMVTTIRANPTARRLTYRLAAGNEGGAFQIEPRTGVVSVRDSGKIDFEGVGRFELRVEAVTAGPGGVVVAALPLPVLIDNIDEAPNLGGPYRFTTALTAANGDTVGYVSADDPEGNDLAFSLAGSSAFGIEPATGRVYVRDRDSLKRGTSVSATVSARDGATWTVSTDVAIDIIDAASSGQLPPAAVTQPGSSAPRAEYSVSHAKHLSFNPLAAIEYGSHGAYSVAFDRSRYRLEFAAGELVGVFGTGSEAVPWPSGGELLVGAFDLGALYVRADGTFRYQPAKNLVADGRLSTLGGGGAYTFDGDQIGYRVTAGGESSEREFTVRVTNSLPVFRSEYTAQVGANGVNRLVLDDPLEVTRNTSYEFDLANLLVDPDGDAVRVTRIKSLQAPVDHASRVKKMAAGVPRFEVDPTSSDSASSPSLWTGIGYVEVQPAPNDPTSSSGVFGATILRKLFLETLPGDPGVLVIRHDVSLDDYKAPAGDRRGTTFVSAANAATYAYSIEVSDGASPSIKPASFEVTLKPYTAAASKPSADLPVWADATSAAGSLAPVLEAKNWASGAWDLQAPRGVDRRVHVGDALVDPVTGSHVRRHALPLDGAGGASSQALPGLVYDSATAAPRAVIEARLALPGGYKLAKGESLSSVTATLRWFDHNVADGNPFELTQRVATEALSKREWAFRFESPEAVVTGVYRWEVTFEVEASRTGSSGRIESGVARFVETGESALVALKPVNVASFGASPVRYWNYAADFGSGWALDGAPQLFHDERDRYASSDDRYVLWFPGESPRVFRLDPAGAVQYEAENQTEAGVGAPSAGRFVSVDTATGLPDAREFGVMRSVDSSDGAGTRLVYTSGAGDSYVFRRDPSDGTTGTDPEYVPLWRLDEIRRPDAPGVVKFTYNAGSSSVASQLTAIEFRVGHATAARLQVEGSGSTRTLRLRQSGSPTSAETIATLATLTYSPDETRRLMMITGAGRTRTFSYSPNTALITADRWGAGLVETSFKYGGLGAGLTLVTPGQGSPLEVLSVASSGTAAGERIASVLQKTDIGDAKEWRTDYIYDRYGGLVERRLSLGAVGRTASKTNLTTEKWARDHLGAVTSAVDTLGRTTYYTYDYQTEVRYVGQTSDSSASDSTPQYDEDDFRGNVTSTVTYGGVTRFEYETDDNAGAALGTLIMSVTPAGLVTEYARDSRGRLRTVSRSGADVGTASVERWDYQDSAVATGPFTAFPSSYTDPLGRTTSYSYDSRGRVESITTVDDGIAGGAAAAETLLTVFGYDGLGFVDTVTAYSGPSAVAGSRVSVTDYDYDAWGLLRSESIEDGAGAILFSSAYAYRGDGLIATKTDGVGNQTRYSYDRRGLLTSVVEADQDSASRTTAYAYYTDGRLRETTQPDATKVRKSYSFTPAGFSESTAVVSGAATLVELSAATGAASSGSPIVAVGWQDAVSVRHFDHAGRVLAVRDDLTGAEATYSYLDPRIDAPTRIVERVNLAGQVGADSKSIATTRLAYDAAGNVVYERGADQAARVSAFDALGRLTSTRVAAPLGAAFAYTHDAAGNVLSETEFRRTPGGAEGATMIASEHITTYRYDESGRLRSVTDSADTAGAPSTATIDYAFASLFGAPGGELTREVTSTSREGVASKRYIDAAGRTVGEESAAGGRTTHTYDQAGDLRWTSFTPPVADAAPARVLERLYDGLNRLVEVRDHGSSAADGAPLVTEIAYHNTPLEGLWDVVTTEPSGRVTKEAFDALGNPIATREGSAAELDDDLVTLYSRAYDAAHGLTVVTTRTTSPRGEADRSSPTRQFDETRVSRRLTNTRGDVVAEGVGRSNAVQASDQIPAGALPGGDYFGVGQYDVRVRRAVDLAGRVAWEKNAQGETTSYSYDVTQAGAGLVAAVKRPDAAEVRYTYDSVGNLVRRTWADEAADWEYDGLSRVTRESTRGAVGEMESASIQQTWTYNGLVSTHTDRNGVVVATTRSTDGRNLTEVATYPLEVGQAVARTLTTTTALNSDGSVGSITQTWAGVWGGVDRSGDQTVVVMEYDEFGREASARTEVAATLAGAAYRAKLSTPEHHVSGAWKRSALDLDWDLNDASDGSLALNRSRTFDTRGRVVSQGHDFAGVNEDNWSALPQAKSVAVTYGADGAPRVVRRSVDGTVRGRSDYEYDDSGRLTSLVHRAGADPDAPALASYLTTSFDAEGRPKVQVESLYHYDVDPGEAATYTLLRRDSTESYYDASGRPKDRTVVPPSDGDPSTTAPETYRYDPLGNRVDRESVLGAGNRLLADATHRYEYDAAGNVVLKHPANGPAIGERWEYGWDHRGRLLSVEYEAGTTPSADDYRVEYLYDGLDRLVARRETRNPGAVGGGDVSTIGYAYDGARRVLELDLDTRVARFDYLDGPTGELAAVDSTWLLNDPSGSASTPARYDAAGHWLASHRNFDAFGDSRAWGVSLVDADTDVTDAEDRRVLGNEADFFAEYPRVYQGGYWDAGAGLYELGGSWYDPLTGRFAQDTGGENGYAFAGDAPDRSRVSLASEVDNSYGLIRGLVGDQTLAGASDWQLRLGTAAFSAGIVVGGWAGLGSLGLVGGGAAVAGSGSALGAAGSFVSYASLGYSAGVTALTGTGTGDLASDSASLAIDALAGVTTGRIRGALLAADLLINYAQGLRNLGAGLDALEKEDYRGATLAFVGAGFSGLAGTNRYADLNLGAPSTRLHPRAGVLRLGGNSPEIADAIESATLTVKRGSEIGIHRQPRHHIFPKEHQEFFVHRSLRNIDDYTLPLDRASHEAIHIWVTSGKWNDVIIERVLEREADLGRLLNRREVLAVGAQLRRDAGLSDIKVVKYQD